MRALIAESRRVLMACAVAGLVLLLSWPAAAQTIICDSDFLTANWQLQVFACPVGSPNNTVTATQQSTGGSTGSLPNPQPPATCPLNTNYRDVKDILNVLGNGGGPSCPAESIVYGVHSFSGTYTPAVSGEIASIGFQIDYQCLAAGAIPCQFLGQAFGPALVQGSNYFVANGPNTTTGITGWKRSSRTPLLQNDFNQISVGVVSGNAVITIDPTKHPDFSSKGLPIQCGFYTGNASQGPTYVQQAGYDNWSCTITPVGVLKVCKVAGPGIAVGTPFSFTANGTAFQVPAGAGPGGTCVVVTPNPGFAVGTTVNIVETIPPGVAVSNIAVAVGPPGSVVSTNNATGTASVIIGNGVTEVTYTDYKTTGYLEICKTGVAGGSFTVNPGNLGPFAVPVGACSPAIQVTAGQVTITEAPISGTAINSCTTFPSGRLVSCPPTTPNVVVNVVPGDVPSETIVTVNNVRSRDPGGPPQ